MSLKGFHLVFITASILLALFYAAVSLQDYREGGGSGALVTAAGSLLAGLTLFVYEAWFLRKTRRPS